MILLCGNEDLLSSPADYNWLYSELKDRNNVVFKEYDLGHLGLMMPKDSQ